MEVYSPPQTVDFTDTGLWRLIIYISASGMRAYLRHISDASQPVVSLFTEEWGEDESLLLSRIESAVYDHPRLLEDYATDIIIETSRHTWVPDEILDTDGVEEEIFSTLFPSASVEVMSEHCGNQTALFSLVSGLSAFVGRTLPGSRIRSHIGTMADHFNRIYSDSPSIFVDIRERECDLVAFQSGKVTGSATQKYSQPSDIVYRIMHLALTSGFRNDDMIVSISGKEELRAEVRELLNQLKVKNVETQIVNSHSEIPLAAAILAKL